LSKTWNSPEWKTKRAAYLAEHPVCEMPGCIEKATVIHHRVKANVGLAKWREIYRNAERSRKNSLLTTHQLTALTNEKYAAFKARVEATYLDFTPETVEALCKRCHAARDHGKVLCLKCGENYHNPRYPACYKCNQTETVVSRRVQPERPDPEKAGNHRPKRKRKREK